MSTYNFNYSNELPVITIGDKAFTVNNRKSTAKKLANAKRNKKNGEDDDRILIETLMGPEAADYIDSLDLPLPVYKELFYTVMAAYNGTSVEKMKEQLGDTQ